MTQDEINALREQLRTEVRAEFEGVLAKNRELLGEKKKLQSERDRLLGLAVKRDPLPPSAEVITMTRSEAQNPATYRSVREEAAAAGKRVTIVADEQPRAADDADKPSPLKVFSDDRFYWANVQYQKKVGLVRARAEAERAGKEYRAFRRAAELPAEARSIHDRLIEQANPEQMLFEGDAQ